MELEFLSEAELSALEAHMSATESAMSLAEARGYLTAVASAPTLVRPGDWLPIVVGEGGFADLKEANRIFGLLTRLYNGIITTLDAGGPVAPGLKTSNEEVAAWCAGFLRLAQSDPRWTADETGVELIIPIASLATGADLDQPDDGTPDPLMSAEQRARYRGGLEDCVRAIDLYWGARRTPPPAGPVVRAAPKVGRNEVCPCGSGKKYKRCHGTVH
jgi:uncharacterized protein